MRTLPPLRPTAQSISAFLRRIGYRPVPTRNREGVHVSGGLGTIYVSMQWDSEATNRRVADDVYRELLRAGYTTHRGPGHSIAVLR